MTKSDVDGFVADGFEPVRDVFIANINGHFDVGASCCVYLGGHEVVDLSGGTKALDRRTPYTGKTHQMVMSTTKGVVAIAAHMLSEEGRLDFDAPVSKYWPEFAAEGKGNVPVRWLFSHRAGLPVIDTPLTVAEMYLWDPVVDAIAQQRPYWEPGTAHGYHAVSYGWLTGEVIRRAAVKSVGRYVAERIAGPLGIDFWIGLPESMTESVAPLIPAPKVGTDQRPDSFAARLEDPASLLHKAYGNPPCPPELFNEPAFWRAEIPALNGIGTARSLCRMYAACIGEVDGVRLLRAETTDRARQTESLGHDLVLGYDTRYGTGFQLRSPTRPMAGEGSFGHHGMGGSVAFAHPELRLAFAYVMNQMQSPSGPDPRSTALIEAAVRCIA